MDFIKEFRIPKKQCRSYEYAAFWEDFLTDEEIKILQDLPEWSNLYDAVIDGNIVNKSVRSSSMSWANYDEKSYHVWKKITNVVSEVNENFFHLDLNEFSDSPQLTLYSSHENHLDFYDWHTDMILGSPVTRKLSMSLLLSDPSEFEGGEFLIKTDGDRIMTLKQAKGRAWFFPSYIHHKVAPVTKGIRRSVVLWAAGDPFR